MTRPFLQRIWGEASAMLARSRQIAWVDLLLLGCLVGLVFGLFQLSQTWGSGGQRVAEIHLEPWYLPLYTFYSLCRGLVAYLLSLGFTLSYGYWAAKDRVARRVLIPLLDILQSVPVLAFLPVVVFGLAGLFPTSNLGVELAAVVLIFTGQAWNMTFSFYHSVSSVPLDQNEVATVYRFSWWQRFRWVEVPYSMVGLVWNSMMSMAGGWFFLAICETYGLSEGTVVFRLQGIGSYMKKAVDDEDYWAMGWAVFAMVSMIVLLDQLLWRPVVVWAQKFRVEEGGAQEEMTSWFLNWLRRSRLLAWLGSWFQGLHRERAVAPPPTVAEPAPSGRRRLGSQLVSVVLLGSVVVMLLYGGWSLVVLLTEVAWERWGELLLLAAVTLGRVLLAVVLGTLWTVPVGLAIGLSPRLSRALQPLVQVVASFPAPMLFPLVVFVLGSVGMSLNWGSILLMLLGTQWYILFNVIAGSMAIPADMKEAARSYRIRGWQRFWTLYAPAIFPYLLTGWVTAAGGAWNATIVSEYVDCKNAPPPAVGLGALIHEASDEGKYALLAASALVMSTVVVLFNRLVWRKLYNLAETRFSLNR